MKHEVQAYLIDTNNNNDLGSLEWWRVNGGKYRNVARFSLNWLAVTATSAPRECVFLMCGLVDTSKRSNLFGVLIEKQALHFIHFKNVVLVFMIISRPLTNRLETVGSESEIHKCSTVTTGKYPNR